MPAFKKCLTCSVLETLILQGNYKNNILHNSLAQDLTKPEARCISVYFVMNVSSEG